MHVAKEGGAFHQHGVAGVHQRLEQQVHAAGAAGGGKHAVALHGEAEVRLEIGRKALQKGRIALGCAILQDAFSVGQQHVARKIGAEPVGQGIQRRVAPGEADHAGPAQHLEDLTDGAAGHLVKPAGVGNRVHQNPSFCIAGPLRPEKRKPPASRKGGRRRKIAVPLPLWRADAPSAALQAPRCKRRTVGPLLMKNRFTAGLREVFTWTAAAFFHLPKALLRRTGPGYLVPSLPMVVL